jgi:hypothetical protein
LIKRTRDRELPDIQSSQGESFRLSLRPFLSPLPDFLSQRQLELLENHEVHIRLKQMNTTQQMILSHITSFEAWELMVVLMEFNLRMNPITLCSNRRASGGKTNYPICSNSFSYVPLRAPWVKFLTINGSELCRRAHFNPNRSSEENKAESERRPMRPQNDQKTLAIGSKLC